MLTPSPSPSLLLELRQLLATDYAVPDLWDADKQVLLDNDAYLHAQVEALKEGTALVPGSITDVHIGPREIRDTHPTSPPSGTYDDTLTNHLRTIATRIRGIMGTASWANGIPTTLAQASAHASNVSDGVHGATSSLTIGRLVIRDANGQAQFGSPTLGAHVARKIDLDTALTNLASHTHDDRYYTKTQLGASGSYGTHPVHADRVSLGTLQAARIPNLDANKIAAGTLALDRIPNIPTNHLSTLHLARLNSVGAPIGAYPSGWTVPTVLDVGRYRIHHPYVVDVLLSMTIVGSVAGTANILTRGTNYVDVQTYDSSGAPLAVAFDFILVPKPGG